jgi:hypothetical protein
MGKVSQNEYVHILREALQSLSTFVLSASLAISVGYFHMGPHVGSSLPRAILARHGIGNFNSARG